MSGPRADLLARLAAHVPFDDEEARALARTVRFVETNARCFERSLETGHVTGSAWIIDRTRSRVLLTHHRKLGMWLQLGGHADGDPDVSAVAAREAREESGIEDLGLLSTAIFDVDAHAIPVRAGEPAHVHYDVRFLFEGDAASRPRVSDESHDVAWVELARVGRLTTDASVLRMVRKTPR